MSQLDVLIVGAGPTGLAAAIEARRCGLSYRVIEHRGEPARWSQALVVQARTLEQFARYGIADRFTTAGQIVRRMQLAIDGKRLPPFVLDGISGNFPFALFVPQHDTELLLIDHLNEIGGPVERGLSLTKFRDDGSVITASLAKDDGSTEEVEAKFLIASDGAHSTVRNLLGFDFPGAAVPMHFYLSDCTMTGKDRPVDGIHAYIADGAFAFLAPVTKAETRVIVAIHAVGTPERELSDEQMQAMIDRVTHGSADLRIVKSSWRAPFHVNERELETFRQGSVFFIGDSAHVHSPVFGQGMNTGIQDAANLVWKLAAVRGGAPDILLDSYDAERRPVAHDVVEASSRMLAMVTSDTAAAAALREIGANIAMRFPPLRRHMARFISETAIAYRKSSVVRDHGGNGRLLAGDRAPDLCFPKSATEAENALLETLRHGRHVVVSISAENRTMVVRENCHVIELEIKLKAATGEGASLYGNDTCYAIRPDGYIGYRGPLHASHLLADYLSEMGTGPSATP